MAKFKPYKASAKFNAVMITCDAIGMTDIPGISQAFELVSGVGSLLTGDLVGFGLSVGSMVPIAGKTCEVAKAARRAERLVSASTDVVKNADKVADTATTAGKNAKLGELSVTQKLKDLENGAKEVTKKNSKSKQGSAPKSRPAPAATQAQPPKIEGPKEVQISRKLDVRDGITNSAGTPYKNLNDAAEQKIERGLTHQNYYSYKSNPAVSHIYWGTAKYYPF